MPNESNSQNTSSLQRELVLSALLCLLIVGCRWGIEIPNFKPVMAVAMLAGFVFSRRWLGVATVVAGMLLSDLLLGFYEWQVNVTVYVALVCPLFCGLLMKRWKNQPIKVSTGVLGFAGLSALFFYVTTTLSLWLFFDWYPSTLSGLMTAFAMGLPFLKWTLMGNVFFSVTLFGLVGLASWATRRQLANRGVQPAPIKAG